MSHGHLWDRLKEARSRLEPIQSKYRVIYENPDDLDAPAAIMCPAPEWLAAAMAGGILPPIETYQRDALTPDGSAKEHPYAKPIGPMTEEEAMEYLVMKDVSPAVWRDYTGNRAILKIVPMEMIPTDRTHRNAWRIAQ